MSERQHTRSAGVGHTQEAGSAHYQAMKIQPIDYIEANELGFHEGNVVKYITRWRKVDGLKDLEKAEWYIQRLIENAKKQNPTMIVAASVGTFDDQIKELQEAFDRASQPHRFQGLTQMPCEICGKSYEKDIHRVSTT